jgi:Ca2+-binding RTX toxin-like protein
MESNANTLVTMGIISGEVYNSDYFTIKDDGSLVKDTIEGTTYKVIDHTPNSTLSGFNALLLQDTAGNYVLAYRGTEWYSISDWVTNIQIGIDNYAPQFDEAYNFTLDMIVKYTIDTSELTLTGHSLGGMLTQSVGAVLQIPGYAYNPWGSDVLATLEPDNISDQLLQYLQRAISGSQYPDANLEFAANNIFNISYQDDGFLNGDGLSNLATGIISEHLGNFIPIWGANEGPLDGHDINTLIPAIEHANVILSHFPNSTYNELSDVYTASGYAKAESIFNDLDIYHNSNLSFDILTNKTPSQLQSKDPANLYALLNLNPFVINGNLSAYADINPDDYSDMYMSDRVEFFYNYLHDITTTGTVYQDVKSGINNGFGLNKVVFGTEENNITTLSGFSGDDRIYGLAGDDTLVGNAGNDYLEGGTGSDTLYGDSGHDILFGDNDSDVLYGGAGQDTLIGGDNDNASDALFGGSGEDVLLGGGGDDTLAGGDASNLYSDKVSDYLAGGVGHDIYYVSHQDIINDADSTGFIMFNDKSLSGTKTKVEDSDTLYEDDYFLYALDGSNMVVVEKTTQEYITIENFNFGMSGMGMEFDDGTEDPTKKDVEIYVGDATVTEGGTLEFTVGINNTLDNDLTINIGAYFNDSADSNDIKMPQATAIIKAGSTSVDISVDTIDDTTPEPTENFIFAVTGQTYTPSENESEVNFLIMNAGEGTITDNDEEPEPEPLTISVSDGSRIEVNGEIQFTVYLSGTLEDGESLTVNFATSDGSATGSYICQDDSWYVAMNNRDFSIQREVG